MYCQQRFFAFLYALLDLTFIRSRSVPYLDMGSRGDMPFCIECIPTTLSNTTSIDVYQLDGLSCAMSLNCTSVLDSAPVLLVNLSGIAYPKLQVNSPLSVALLSPVLQVKLASSRGGVNCLEKPIPINSDKPNYHPIQQNYHSSSGLVREDNTYKSLSMQGDLQQIHASRTRVSEPCPAARPDSTTQVYVGSLESCLIYIRDRIIQIFTVNATLDDPYTKGEVRKRSIRQRLHNLRAHCQDRICRGYDLMKLCTSSSMSTAEKDACATCYPRKNLRLIRDRCNVHRAGLYQVLYWACMLLGLFAMVAVLLYVARSYRRWRRSRTSRNLAAETLLSSDLLPMAITTSVSTSSYNALDLRTEHTPAIGDKQNSEANLSMTERRLRRLGLFNREPRKGVRDVFDLESHGCIHEGSGILKERVPVLPRASNASLRRHFATRNMKQAPRGPSDGDNRTHSG